MKRKIITTNDGSKTIFLPDWNENYHSKHGALQEALHVFIESGYVHSQQNPLRILEVGFGSGLNAILTYVASIKDERSVEYTGLEAFPISQEELNALAYDELPAIEKYAAVLGQMHDAEWETKTAISPGFSLQKTQQTLEEFEPKPNHFDLIYFDAFGPRVQPEMWTKEILSKMYESLDAKGIFVTYCAKGQVRRDLESLGFDVEKIPGPPGKREMLRATK